MALSKYRGAFSVVKFGKDLETNKNCAIKITDLLKLQESYDLNAGGKFQEWLIVTTYV